MVKSFRKHNKICRSATHRRQKRVHKSKRKKNLKRQSRKKNLKSFRGGNNDVPNVPNYETMMKVHKYLKEKEKKDKIEEGWIHFIEEFPHRPQKTPKGESEVVVKKGDHHPDSLADIKLKKEPCARWSEVNKYFNFKNIVMEKRKDFDAKERPIVQQGIEEEEKGMKLTEEYEDRKEAEAAAAAAAAAEEEEERRWAKKKNIEKWNAMTDEQKDEWFRQRDAEKAKQNEARMEKVEAKKAERAEAWTDWENEVKERVEEELNRRWEAYNANMKKCICGEDTFPNIQEEFRHVCRAAQMWQYHVTKNNEMFNMFKKSIPQKASKMISPGKELINNVFNDKTKRIALHENLKDFDKDITDRYQKYKGDEFNFLIRELDLIDKTSEGFLLTLRDTLMKSKQWKSLEKAAGVEDGEAEAADGVEDGEAKAADSVEDGEAKDTVVMDSTRNESNVTEAPKPTNKKRLSEKYRRILERETEKGPTRMRMSIKQLPGRVPEEADER